MSDKKQNKRNGENILHINKIQWHLQKILHRISTKMLHEHNRLLLFVCLLPFPIKENNLKIVIQIVKREDRSALKTNDRLQKILLLNVSENAGDENLNNNGARGILEILVDSLFSRIKQLSKISAHYFFLPFSLPLHSVILTLKTSTIISQLSNPALWEFRYRRMLSLGLHCMSCQRAIVIQERVALSLIVYQMAVWFSRQTQISSHRIQFHPSWHPTISSASTLEPVTWLYHSILTLKPHNAIR